MTEHQKLHQKVGDPLCMLIQRIKHILCQFDRLLVPLIAPEVFNEYSPLGIVLLKAFKFENSDATATPSITHDVRKQADH